MKTRTFPIPRYPLPDIDNPWAAQLQAETEQWLDEHYQFLSAYTREKYKQMRLSQFASRSYPRTVSYAHLRACCLFTFTATIMDDYYECCTAAEIETLRQRVTGIFRGDQPTPADNGILQQMAMARDALRALMPDQWMQRFIAHIDDYIGKGMKAESPYILQRQLPALADYLAIREHSIGAYVMCDLVETALGFALPAHITSHPDLQRLVQLGCRVSAWLNDFISLEKDLLRESEVMNLVLVMQQEYGLPLEAAYEAAMQLHDEELEAFIALQDQLPDFGVYEAAVRNYIYHLVLMVQGERTWYLKDTLRYTPGGYAEPEYRR